MTEFANSKLIEGIDEGISFIGAYLHQFTPSQMEALKHAHKRLGVFIDQAETQPTGTQEEALSRFLRNLPLHDAKAALFEDAGYPVPEFWFGDKVLHIATGIEMVVIGLVNHLEPSSFYYVCTNEDGWNDDTDFCLPNELRKIDE